MSKDDRSGLNPFTGKSHYDNVDDDKFLDEYYNYYYDMINKYLKSYFKFNKCC